MFELLVGESPCFVAQLRNARMVASAHVTVLLVGEAGTGKEAIARAIHQQSLRVDKPFIALSCDTLRESFAESDMCERCKEAFAAVVADHVGKLRAADGGTVFIDAVDLLPLPLQSKLLRVLEIGEIRAVGETKSTRVDVRIIAATTCALQEKVARSDFRKDLYHRLNVVQLEIPPLRERDGDIEVLLRHYAAQFAQSHGLPVARFDDAALACLNRYPWPCNVRELRNLCERIALLVPGGTVQVSDLPPEIREYSPDSASVPLSFGDLGVDLTDLEVRLIQESLRRTRGNRIQSARLLGISRDLLLHRMQKYGIS